MVNLPRFEVDHWIADHSKAKHNLANTNALPVSIQDLESLPGDASASDLLSSIRSRPLGYGTSFNGLESLRSKIANLYSESLSVENVLTTPGGTLANLIVFFALVGPGDHVIVPSPVYQQLSEVPAALGAEVEFWKAEESKGWKFDMEELKRLVRPNTKMIVLTNPLNPVGTILSKRDLEQIVQIAAEHNIIIFSDEIYRPIFYSTTSTPIEVPPSILSFDYKNTVVTSSLSKSYSLAGIRLGWLVSRDPSIINLCTNARCYCLITTSQIDEHIADFALDKTRMSSIVQTNIDRTRKNRAVVQAFIDELSDICAWVPPIGGPMGFIKFSRQGKPLDDAKFCDRLYKEKEVLLVPAGPGFGKDFAGYVRIGLGGDTQALATGLKVVKGFIQDHLDELDLVA